MIIRIAITDDDAPYRAAIADLLSLEPSLEVAGVFASARELLDRAAAAAAPPWDLVLMDIEMPDLDGITATTALKQHFPRIPVVMLTSFEEPERILQAIVAGADGYLVKRSNAREVLEEVRSVAAGGSPLTPSVARSVLAAIRGSSAAPREKTRASAASFDLSERELEVLRALVDGRGYKQIASDLQISVDTVRSHIRNIYRKLQVHSGPEAVARALRERIV